MLFALRLLAAFTAASTGYLIATASESQASEHEARLSRIRDRAARFFEQEEQRGLHLQRFRSLQQHRISLPKVFSHSLSLRVE